MHSQQSRSIVQRTDCSFLFVETDVIVVDLQVTFKFLDVNGSLKQGSENESLIICKMLDQIVGTLLVPACINGLNSSSSIVNKAVSVKPTIDMATDLAHSASYSLTAFLRPHTLFMSPIHADYHLEDEDKN